MRGREFLNASEYLLKRKEEAMLRSAVSRGYYALFHESRNFLESLQISGSKGPQAHGEVRNRLNNCGDQQMQEVSRLLAQLHKQRLLVDYNLEEKALFDINTCTLLVKSAAIGIELLDIVQGSSSQCGQIRGSILEYETKTLR